MIKLIYLKIEQITKEDYFKISAKDLQRLETDNVIITTESQKAAGVINNFENLKLIQAKDGDLKQELKHNVRKQRNKRC